MRHATLVAGGFGLVGSLLLQLGCQQAKSSEQAWPKEALEYAVYATQLPIYPGAELEDVMGADTYGDEPGSHNERMNFWFTVEDSPEEMIAWYDARLPEATKEESDEGDIVYTLTPTGAEEGEYFGVRVEADGGLRIFENTLGGKH